jgi:hypothetical protein
MTLAEGRWRVAPHRPVTVAWEPWKMAVVGGMAYFVTMDKKSTAPNIEVDTIALFDFVTEKWRSKTLNVPLTTSLLTSTHQNLHHSKDITRFHLSRMSGCLVMVHQNDYDSRTDLWFLDNIEMPLWNKRYSIPWTAVWQPYGYIHTIIVLQDGRM